MKFGALLLPGLLSFFAASGQKLNCSCAALIDYEHRGAVPIFDKPNGRIIRRVTHHFNAEDYLGLAIDGEQGNFFHGQVAYAVSGQSYRGWVQKAPWLGTYARNYDQAKLRLYRTPSLAAPAQAYVPAPVSGLYAIRRCAGAWAYVRIVRQGRAYEGWLPPTMQCANHYTTCN